jgi:hypothetical protein
MTTDTLVKDKFQIDNTARHDDCTLYCYINIDGHILIRVVQSDWDTDDYGEANCDHNDAGIELNVEMATRLRDELNRLIESKLS